LAQAVSTLGIDGIYLDSWGAQDDRCYASHAHSPGSNKPRGEIFQEGYRDLVKGIRQALDAIDPSIALYEERGNSDDVLQYTDGSLTFAFENTSFFYPTLLCPYIYIPRFIFPDYAGIHLAESNQIQYLKYAFFNGTGWHDLTLWREPEYTTDAYIPDVANGGDELYRNQPEMIYSLWLKLVRTLKENGDAFSGDQPYPLIDTLRADAYVNKFPIQDKVVYTVLRPNFNATSETIFEVPAAGDNWHYVDVHNNVPVRKDVVGGKDRLTFSVYPAACYPPGRRQPRDCVTCIAAFPAVLSVTRMPQAIDMVLRQDLLSQRLAEPILKVMYVRGNRSVEKDVVVVNDRAYVDWKEEFGVQSLSPEDHFVLKLMKRVPLDRYAVGQYLVDEIVLDGASLMPAVTITEAPHQVSAGQSNIRFACLLSQMPGSYAVNWEVPSGWTWRATNADGSAMALDVPEGVVPGGYTLSVKVIYPGSVLETIDSVRVIVNDARWLSPGHLYKTEVLVDVDKPTEMEIPVEANVNFTSLLGNPALYLDDGSIRMFDVTGGGSIETPVQFDRSPDYDARTHASGTLIWMLSRNEEGKRTYDIYFNALVSPPVPVPNPYPGLHVEGFVVFSGSDRVLDATDNTGFKIYHQGQDAGTIVPKCSVRDRNSVLHSSSIAAKTIESQGPLKVVLSVRSDGSDISCNQKYALYRQTDGRLFLRLDTNTVFKKSYTLINQSGAVYTHVSNVSWGYGGTTPRGWYQGNMDDLNMSVGPLIAPTSATYSTYAQKVVGRPYTKIYQEDLAPKTFGMEKVKATNRWYLNHTGDVAWQTMYNATRGVAAIHNSKWWSLAGGLTGYKSTGGGMCPDKDRFHIFWSNKGTAQMRAPGYPSPDYDANWNNTPVSNGHALEMTLYYITYSGMAHPQIESMYSSLSRYPVVVAGSSAVSSNQDTITGLVLDGNSHPVLTWNSASGGDYQVYSSNGPFGDAMEWLPGSDIIHASGISSVWVDNDPVLLQLRERYYRILIIK
jgi:hypothetical protein